MSYKGDLEPGVGLMPVFVRTTGPGSPAAMYAGFRKAGDTEFDKD